MKEEIKVKKRINSIFKIINFPFFYNLNLLEWIFS
jgi:hypothetical protein